VFVPAELAVTDEEPEKPNLPSRSSLAKDHFALPAARWCSATGRIASPQVRSLSARRAQNINARVRDTLPDVITALKSKTELCCAEIVEGGDLLWMGLQIEVETQKPQPQRTRRSQRKKKGREYSRPCISALFRTFVRFWLKANS